MLAITFNEKYKEFLEPGFEDQGLEIDDPKVVEFLDEIFKDFTKIPGFKYSQIKYKFRSTRFYTTLNGSLNALVENELNSILGL